MHWTTAKSIALERAEGFLAHGWTLPAQVAFAEQVKSLRREIPPSPLATYDQLKAGQKEPLVGVFQTRRGGCHSVLSAAALARLRKECEISQCEQCGRLLCLTGGHDLTARPGVFPSKLRVPHE